MANKVIVNVDSRPEGEDIEVLYLGVFPNGATSDVSDEQATTWSALTGRDYPASGYIVGGEPKTPQQEQIVEANNKEAEVPYTSNNAIPDSDFAEATIRPRVMADGSAAPGTVGTSQSVPDQTGAKAPVVPPPAPTAPPAAPAPKEGE